MLRRDGFVGYSAGASAPSRVVTQPFRLPEPHGCGASSSLVLLLNVAVAASGGVRVGFSGAAHFSLASSDVIRGDHVRAVASWRGSAALTTLAAGGGALTMTVELRQAELFAWEWRCA